MTVSLEFWQLVTLLLSFFGFVGAAGKILFAQVDRRLTERFAAAEASRQAATTHWDERFATLFDQRRQDAEGLQKLERDLLRMQAELPLNYVRREDYIRGQTVIEAKIDRVYAKLEATAERRSSRD